MARLGVKVLLLPLLAAPSLAWTPSCADGHGVKDEEVSLLQTGIAQRNISLDAGNSYCQLGPDNYAAMDAACGALASAPRGSSLASCGRLCDDTAGCTSFNFDVLNGGCILRACKEPTKIRLNPTEGFAFYHSGECRASQYCQMAPDGFAASDSSCANLANYQAGTSAECGRLCDQRSECTSFNFAVASGVCVLRACPDLPSTQLTLTTDFAFYGPCKAGKSFCNLAPRDFAATDGSCPNLGRYRAGTSVEECGRLCGETVGCTSFNFNMELGGCTLRGCRDPARMALGLVVGAAFYGPCGGEASQLFCQLSGSGYAALGGSCTHLGLHVAGSSADACGSQCRQQRGCTNFNFSPETGSCDLRGCTNPSSSALKVASGYAFYGPCA